jgi:hypothetical protein
MSQPSQIDPRGPQFTAALTSVVLALVLLTAPSTLGTTLLAVQAALFAVGVGLGVQRGPWALLFRRVVRPRLAPPAHLEDPAPPRFAQGVGLVFALVALAGYLAGAPVIGAVATGFALVAALLNAVFRFCLGCEMYLLFRRLLPSRTRVDDAARAGRENETDNRFENKEKVIT